MMMRICIMCSVGLILAGCGQTKPKVVSSPYASGVAHSEPVFYNGKHYKVNFVYQAARNVYDVNVAGKGGRKLGGKPGDQQIVSAMATSAMSHFSCGGGLKAKILPGSSRHESGRWYMQTRCG